MNFHTFAKEIERQFAALSGYPLFRVNLDKGTMWQTYLASFPEGSNPIYRERTTHDCSCCRHFIRDVGNIVAIVNNQLVSIWDIDTAKIDVEYAKVTRSMAKLVKAATISEPFLIGTPKVGAEVTRATEDGVVVIYNHFFATVPTEFVKRRDVIPGILGDARTTHAVYLRALNEITVDAVDQVIELISSDSIYRGAEFLPAVKAFAALQKKAAKAKDKTLFAWRTCLDNGTRIRNTAIGTLLVDLSEGVPLETAVASFEAKVAPTNYKRPKSPVTQRMIDDAKAKVEELGLLPALDRRYAALTDISINEVLFADRNAAPKMKDSDPFSVPTRSTPKAFDNVTTVPLQKFLDDIVPSADSIELLVENTHVPRLVSLVTADTADTKPLFKWDNQFSWSYNGDVTDSDIRAAVQARGGRVDGVFRFSHSWNYDKRNASLMDLHVFLPGHNGHNNGVHNNYGNGERVGWNRRNHYASGGVQDVDYTHPAPAGYVPVENITFPDIKRMSDGKYVCKIHNWDLRSPTQGGFRAEIEFGGQVYEYEQTTPLKNKEWVHVANVTKKGAEFHIEHVMPCGTAPREVWNVKTGEFQRVSAMCFSPNHWGDKPTGNKHLFLFLQGCANEDNARGFYNEFLRADLDPHRKVLELVGSRQRTKETENQLSGVGFSLTQRAEITVRVNGATSRVLKVAI